MARKITIRYPESLTLANLPTPVERLAPLEEFPFLPKIYIKRDDQTGCALSGNKVRKLEFCLAEAKRDGANTIITCGGVQSNHARATAVAAARLGFGSLLVLRGDEPEESDGNIFLNRLVGAEIQFITEEEWDRVDEIMANVADEIAPSGRRAYIVPEGASFPPGVFGYIRAVQEIAEAEEKLGIQFDSIVIPVGSGGTYAGLAFGTTIYGLKARIMGINVLETPEYFKDRIARLSEDFIREYEGALEPTGGLQPLDVEKIEIAGGYEGPAYAVPSPEVLDLIRLFARRRGILLDPTYTGKAMFGLIGEAEKGRWGREVNVLFIHTGGIYSLFPWREELGHDND